MIVAVTVALQSGLRVRNSVSRLGSISQLRDWLLFAADNSPTWAKGAFYPKDRGRTKLAKSRCYCSGLGTRGGLFIAMDPRDAG